MKSKDEKLLQKMIKMRVFTRRHRMFVTSLFFLFLGEGLFCRSERFPPFFIQVQVLRDAIPTTSIVILNVIVN